MMTYEEYRKNPSAYGKELKRLRKERNMNDVRIYFAIGITGSTYRNAEDNLTTMNITTFEKIERWKHEYRTKQIKTK